MANSNGDIGKIWTPLSMVDEVTRSIKDALKNKT